MKTQHTLGISPVLSTIILVATVIVVALAVAYWGSGLVSIFTRFEKLEISHSSMERDDVNHWYIIVIRFKNSGSSDLSITQIVINGKQLNDFWSSAQVDGGITDPILVRAGLNGSISIYFPDKAGSPPKTPFSSGQSVEVRLHSASGTSYPCVLAVP